MRWLDWFGGRDAWQRPTPTIDRHDWRTATGMFLLITFFYELGRSYDSTPDTIPLVWKYVAIVSLALLTLLRRRFPIAIGILAFVHLFVVGVWLRDLNYQLAYQIASFFLFYSTVAWARLRCRTGWVMLLLTVATLGQVLWDTFMAEGWLTILEWTRGADHGLFPAAPAYAVDNLATNLLYMAGAIAVGQSAWNQARDRAVLADQARTIETQAEGLRDQAVLEERVRIARELHDVVAHHVSVMGIQAAAARRTLDSNPDKASLALQNIEATSRESVAQMRALLGTLRANGQEDSSATRAPQPSLGELPALLDSFTDEDFTIDSHLVEEPEGASSSVPLPMQLSLYRSVQEALSNVRRHSTARSADVTIRIQGGPGGYAEAEILDGGRPLGETSGTGLGLVGMKERVSSHNGSYEIGPRREGGYRVRVRLPLPDGNPVGE